MKRIEFSSLKQLQLPRRLEQDKAIIAGAGASASASSAGK
eukprot:CAMPEP_0176498774 /NCGR_PEP_ID=MMETSP0200_2-20121128/12527_1 /TAXON_ID=947934 /ORGANISM="Chaetoceros sp., Strain GSL56" /LENGTH=39 /DNA_ID= /DNA_START= /DNA_END= /DNA_ORIENTATION=